MKLFMENSALSNGLAYNAHWHRYLVTLIEINIFEIYVFFVYHFVLYHKNNLQLTRQTS